MGSASANLYLLKPLQGVERGPSGSAAAAASLHLNEAPAESGGSRKEIKEFLTKGIEKMQVNKGAKGNLWASQQLSGCTR